MFFFLGVCAKVCFFLSGGRVDKQSLENDNKKRGEKSVTIRYWGWQFKMKYRQNKSH